MRVFRDMDSLPQLSGSVVTVGSFDGLHSGHQKLIKKIKQLSQSTEGPSVVITFDPHPRSIVYPKDKSLKILTSLQEKIDLLRNTDIDILVIVPFTVEFSQLAPSEYIEKLLIEKFRPRHLVIGYDHKFGLNRAGNIDLLRSKAQQYNYEVTEISKYEADQLAISSTRIRKAILGGDLETANTLLNRPYELSGHVVRGKKLGTKLGFPTANLKVEDSKKLIPKDGIYACYVVVNGEQYQGMLYIGNIPTLDSTQPTTIEVNIFDFDEDIYDQRISIQLLSYLRDDKKFESLDALKAQLKADKEDSLNFFSGGTALRNLETAVVILNYNTSQFLETYLPSVGFSSEQIFKTVVIDNASTDDSLEVLEEWFPEVQVVSLDKNYGFAGGYNKGLNGIDEKYFVLLNSDVEVTEGWLDPLITYLEEYPECAAVMPKILSYEQRQAFEYAGAAGGHIDYLGYPFCRGRIFDTVEEDAGHYDDIQKIFWASGAAFVCRAEVFRTLGGFDEDFFAHHEEIDLCWRMQRAGYYLAVIPHSVVYHLGGGTMDYGNSRKVFLNFRNSLATLFKNENSFNLFFKLPLRLVLDGIAGIKFLLSGEVASTWAVIKAHFSFYGNIISLIAKRRKVKELVRKHKIISSEKPLIHKHSIIVQYYLSGKKTYDQLKKQSS